MTDCAQDARDALTSIGLTDALRDALIAKLIHQRSHVEVARDEGITPHASRKRLWRARRALASRGLTLPKFPQRPERSQAAPVVVIVAIANVEILSQPLVVTGDGGKPQSPRPLPA